MSRKVKVIEGGICAPKGFQAAAMSCGIKNPAVERLDLALIYSPFPTVGAAVYTQNQVCAAPVRLSSSNLKSAEPRAIIVNSGNANACTGHAGMVNARAMSTATAKALGLKQREIQVCSTGIIGVQMPIERIEPRISELASLLGTDGGPAARAIMTSDTQEKSIAVSVKIGEVKVRIGAIAKGAGMINPHMATMLCFVTTDAAISKAEITAATREAVDCSFNRITVDGDTSTNDTVIVMANHQARNKPITRGGEGSAEFRAALNEVMLILAKRIVADGERVTKLVEVTVRGAASNLDAERVARAVANSKLVKCSWNGNDPNWGRILQAAGAALAGEDLGDIGREAVRAGELAEAGNEVEIGLDIGRGEVTGHAYFSDLNQRYIEINAEYTT